MVRFTLPVLTLLALPCLAEPLPEQSLRPRPIVPLEQLVVATRDRFTSAIVIHSVRLAREDGRKVYIIDCTDAGNKWTRVVYDAHSGAELDQVPMQVPMPLENILARVSHQYPNSRRINTSLQHRDGSLVYVVELGHGQLMGKRRQLTIDAYTGRLLAEDNYDLTADGKQISLAQIVKNAREKYHGMVVLHTRHRVKNNVQVKEIVFLDDHRVRHKMVVNASTGEVLEDKIMSSGPI